MPLVVLQIFYYTMLSHLLSKRDSPGFSAFPSYGDGKQERFLYFSYLRALSSTYTWGRDGNGTQPELYAVFKDRVQHRIYKTCHNEVLFCSQMLSQLLLTIHLPFHYYH